jgi:aldose 1-epimerase
MITKVAHGMSPASEQVWLYILEAGQFRAEISTYGGTLIRMYAPDRYGRRADVVLGYDKLEEYYPSTTYFGALIGRFANRIARGTFTMDGVTYHTPRNDNGLHTLHGGTQGFDKRVWTALTSEADGAPGLHLSLFSPDGEMGFPGNVRAYVDYILQPDGALEITYVATSDRKGPFNMTNHSYFNLSGGGDILEHELKLDCDRYLPVDNLLIPTGQIQAVRGTPFDFTQTKPIGRDLKSAGGYDHCMVLRDGKDSLKTFAWVNDPLSGRTLTVSTTKPAVQLYTGNFLNGSDIGKDGQVYHKHAGFCLETQHFPDAMNHENFPSCLMKPGESYRHTTIYKFGIER